MKDWRSCPQDGSQIKYYRRLEPFSAAGPLEFVAIDILERLPKTPPGNQHMDILTNSTLKLTSWLPAGELLRHILQLCSSTIVYFYIWCPDLCIDQKRPLAPQKTIRNLMLFPGDQKLITSAYHLQTNVHVERYKRILIAKLGHYSFELQRDSDIQELSVTYMYNNDTHRVPETSPSTWYYLANSVRQPHFTDI